MKTLILTVLAFCLAVLPVRAVDCGDNDIGSIPAEVTPATMLVVSDYAAGSTWWTDTGEGCKLAGLIASPAALAHYGATGEYVEFALGPDQAAVPTIESSWVSGGTTHTLRTPKGGLDSATSWAKKHECNLKALQAVFPPDPAQ